MLAVILRDRGANVVTAHDYDAAIEAVTACHPDVLVGDIGLPGKDGYELIRAVRSREAGGETVRPLYAVALTAFGRPEDRSMAVGAGFNLHMSKPLRPLQLISALERLPRHG